MKQTIIKKIDAEASYKVRDIVRLGIILNREGKRDRFLVYRLLRNRQLLGQFSPFGMLEVRGSDLIDFIKKYYRK